VRAFFARVATHTTIAGDREPEQNADDYKGGHGVWDYQYNDDESHKSQSQE
jgi:hypothetical protein